MMTKRMTMEKIVKETMTINQDTILISGDADRNLEAAVVFNQPLAISVYEGK